MIQVSLKVKTMMKLFYKFTIDRIEFVIGYFLNSILLTVFYHLITGKTVEVIYPLCISFCIFAVIMLIKWLKFYRFNQEISLYFSEPFYKYNPRTFEQRVITETIEDVHKKYITSIEKMQKDNINKSRIMSQWIHNLKIPVSIIDVILQKDPLGNKIGENILSDIRHENNKISSGLDDVLEMVRLDEFQKDFVPEKTDLLADLRELINIKKSHFIYNRVFPEIECLNDKVFILTDKKWNRVLLEQLISNAIKYSSNSTQAIRISFKLQIDEKFTTLEIKDQGVGISEYDINRIFEPFFTGENGRKFTNSTGIGLYICAEIAKKLGHLLKVTSELGNGTSVTITYLTKA